jgi:hypothetical protein
MDPGLRRDDDVGSDGNSRVEIAPVWVLAPNQVYFPIPLPLLDLLLSADRRFGGGVSLESHKLIDAVARRESRYSFAFVLPNALHEIGGHTDVKSAVRLSRENLDVVTHTAALANRRAR